MNAIYVQLFEHMKNNLDEFNVLRKNTKQARVNPKELAKDLGFSLGKLNYCLNDIVRDLLK